jgi:hypothetical protein
MDPSGILGPDWNKIWRTVCRHNSHNAFKHVEYFLRYQYNE